MMNLARFSVPPVARSLARGSGRQAAANRPPNSSRVEALVGQGGRPENEFAAARLNPANRSPGLPGAQ